MAGKATSCYLTVCPKGSHKSVFKKMFFTAADMNKYIKTDEFKAQYPEAEFNLVKEVY